MSSVNLVILGLLKKKNMSAYEMKKFIEQIRLQKWMKIGVPTIFQNMKKLAQKGCLSTETIKQGNMPEKVIYSITDSGKEYFAELMEKFSKNPSKIYFDFNAFLINLHLIDKEQGLEMLSNLKQFFHQSKHDLQQDIDLLTGVSIGGKAIMDQYDILFKGLIFWVDNLIDEYKGEEK